MNSRKSDIFSHKMVTMETWGSDLIAIFGLFDLKYPHAEIFMAIRPIIINVIIIIILFF